MNMWPADNFLLESNHAERLYFEYAAGLPVIDFHNHLSPRLIAEDHQFTDMTEIWLDGDHYKWRAMRACGVSEELITGNVSREERFKAWAEIVPRLIGSPLYQWTHMELTRTFGFNELLNGDTAEAAWKSCNKKLSAPEFSTRGLLHRSCVKRLCTTDDPGDDLTHHQHIAKDNSFDIPVTPTFRPDPVFDLRQPETWNDWVNGLGQAANVSIVDWGSLMNALESRIDAFDKAGCRQSDHGLYAPLADACPQPEAEALFDLARNGTALSAEHARQLSSAILYELGLLYHQYGWTQQFHIGPLRNVNSRILETVGRDAGCDTIGDAPVAEALGAMLDRWDRDERLTRTILYNINPRDNELFAAMAGSFNDGSVAGKVQHGAAWWFNDQKDGMERHLTSLANLGVLSTFVGMVTDSRSFLSFSRHEYFRRILCNFLGGQMERGELPEDFALVGTVVHDICYKNAERYFGF